MTTKRNGPRQFESTETAMRVAHLWEAVIATSSVLCLLVKRQPSARRPGRIVANRSLPRIRGLRPIRYSAGAQSSHPDEREGKQRPAHPPTRDAFRSEEHTSELQSLR